MILDGIGFPAVAEPVPIMLVPGYEYRIRMVHTEGEDVWTLARRSVAAGVRVNEPGPDQGVTTTTTTTTETTPYG